ncbi:MAG: hypothetical protein IJO87_03850, partial [Eggerthellaceae bacterium]|nr:hypothetical protein [Eggerthellaceae bacterium]
PSFAPTLTRHFPQGKNVSRETFLVAQRCAQQLASTSKKARLEYQTGLIGCSRNSTYTPL